MVCKVTEGGAAALAGVHPNCRITHAGDSAIRDKPQLLAALSAAAAGSVVEFRLRPLQRFEFFTPARTLAAAAVGLLPDLGERHAPPSAGSVPIWQSESFIDAFADSFIAPPRLSSAHDGFGAMLQARPSPLEYP